MIVAQKIDGRTEAQDVETEKNPADVNARKIAPADAEQPECGEEKAAESKGDPHGDFGEVGPGEQVPRNHNHEGGHDPVVEVELTPVERHVMGTIRALGTVGGICKPEKFRIGKKLEMLLPRDELLGQQAVVTGRLRGGERAPGTAGIGKVIPSDGGEQQLDENGIVKGARRAAGVHLAREKGDGAERGARRPRTRRR